MMTLESMFLHTHTLGRKILCAGECHGYHQCARQW